MHAHAMPRNESAAARDGQRLICERPKRKAHARDANSGTERTARRECGGVIRIAGTRAGRRHRMVYLITSMLKYRFECCPSRFASLEDDPTCFVPS